MCLLLGIKNPILVAKALAIEEMKGSLSLGRVPPMYFDCRDDLMREL